MESKKYAWAWVTANRVLKRRPCELVCAFLDAGAAADMATLFDGEPVIGNIIAILRNAAATNSSFSPPVPVYCRNGLSVTVLTATTSVFVQWREVEHNVSG